MKIICNQKLLANKIGISQKAINGKTTLELLKGILLSAKDGQLKLTGYDLEIGIETYTQAEVIEEGEIVVNARLFGDIIRKLPDSFVEIETDNDNNIYINCVNSRFKIKGESAKEYPKLPEVKEEDLYSIPQDLLKNMIKQTVFATSQDQTKPILMGELLEIENGNINLTRIEKLTRVLADIVNSGKEVTLVSSGAVGVGVGKLKLKEKPTNIREKQALAAIGQCELMHIYSKFFGEYSHTVGQVLLTRDVIEDEHIKQNVCSTFELLLQKGIIPIVNENDTVSIDELENIAKFGDNDNLSAIVSVLIDADLLIILSDIDGFYDSNPKENPNAKLIKQITNMAISLILLFEYCL